MADYEKLLRESPSIDIAESNALVECVRSFLLYYPGRSVRVHIPWCENDYQIDVGTPEGVEEYKRIMDRAAELGVTHLLYTPANSTLSRLEDNADSWGWENVLWFGLGQKLRKGEWDPRRDEIPAGLKAMLDYAASKNLKLMAYAYPSLPFLQKPEWTAWAGAEAAKSGADTGLRSFQDWWLDRLLAFMRTTGAAGYSFDHWWIAQDKASSKYAQWYGCRRILEGLRREAFDAVVDGRQQYQGFGPWTWLAGSYPHPTLTDEQPESFKAFPDLHTDRVSANRQRFAAWTYRVERFTPPEIMPGFITHQSERNDEKEVMRRDRFRPKDWDVLGWKYSLLSSIGTAPFHHVVNFIPARDAEEFAALAAEDKAWFRKWLDWTDENARFLHALRPIIGPPMAGRVDGTAAVVERPRPRLPLQSQPRAQGGPVQARPHDRPGQRREAHDQGALPRGGPARRLGRRVLGLRQRGRPDPARPPSRGLRDLPGPGRDHRTHPLQRPGFRGAHVLPARAGAASPGRWARRARSSSGSPRRPASGPCRSMPCPTRSRPTPGWSRRPCASPGRPSAGPRPPARSRPASRAGSTRPGSRSRPASSPSWPSARRPGP